MVIAPPVADASFALDDTEFLSNVQLLMSIRIFGGLSSLDTVGSLVPIHTDALFEVPVAIAPPDAEQLRPAHSAAPKVNEDERIVTRLL